jgi:hypothetical protein
MPTVLRYSSILAAVVCFGYAAMFVLANFVDVPLREIAVTVFDERPKASAVAAATPVAVRAARKPGRSAKAPAHNRTAQRKER